jgi:glycosyltransferase involved in cell wall biosynthesis
MRIAMVGPYPPPGRPPTGGIEAVSVSLVRALLDSGVDVTVVTSTDLVRRPREERDGDLTMRLVPAGTLSRGSVPYLAEGRLIMRTLRRLAPDIVHAQGQTHTTLAAIAAGLPTVVTLHGIIYRERLIGDPTATRAARIRERAAKGLYARFERETLRRARDLIMISPYVRESVAPLSRARLHDIPNPIDDSFYAVRREPVPGRILFVGVISPRKNVLILARSFREVARRVPHASLHIVGRPGDRAYLDALRAMLAEDGLKAHARYLGVVSDEELRREYAEADLLVLPSKEESSPMVVQQAQAMGLPVVGSRAGGIPYLVENGITGMLVTPDDDVELAEGIIGALSEPALLKRMSDDSRARANRFRRSAVADATTELYREIANRG